MDAALRVKKARNIPHETRKTRMDDMFLYSFKTVSNRDSDLGIMTVLLLLAESRELSHGSSPQICQKRNSPHDHSFWAADNRDIGSEFSSSGVHDTNKVESCISD